ncbi:hypothetical protein PV416_26505 [Streptomyces ipomoeae]|nr:hypothetical protein [Streptomyces ipomoeae]
MPVNRRMRLAAEAQRVPHTDDSGRLSYSWTRRRCGIIVPLVCSTTHRFDHLQ